MKEKNEEMDKNTLGVGKMMDVEEVSGDDVVDDDDPIPYNEPAVGAIWKHRLLLWTVVIDWISSQCVAFHTKDTNDPEFLYIRRSRENFLEEFSYCSVA